MIKKVELDYASEIGEVAKLVVEVVKVAKSDAKEWGTLLDDLVVAVNGCQEIPAELKDKGVAIGTCMYELSKIVDVLL